MNIQEMAAYVYGSAEEVRRLSELAHSIPGYTFIIVAILILLAGLGYHKKILTYLYNIILIFISITLTSYFVIEKGLVNIPFVLKLVFYYPEVYVHLFMTIAVIIGSSLEILYEKKILKNKLFHLSIPFTFLFLGYINILHPHGPIHDEKDMFYHTVMGTLLTLTGLSFVINRLTKKRESKFFLVIGFICLTIVGIMFIKYKNPPIAYEYAFPQKNVESKNINYINLNEFGIIYIYKDHVSPQSIKLKEGGILRFIQVDESVHDLSSGPHPTHTEYPPLNIGYLEKNEFRDVKFNKIGSFGFHDHIDEENENLQVKILIVN